MPLKLPIFTLYSGSLVARQQYHDPTRFSVQDKNVQQHLPGRTAKQHINAMLCRRKVSNERSVNYQNTRQRCME